jgi:hypothetical protein
MSGNLVSEEEVAMKGMMRLSLVIGVVGVIGAAPPSTARAAPSFAHQCFTARDGQTYELQYSITQDDPEGVAAGRTLQGQVTVLDPGSQIFTFKGVTAAGKSTKIAETTNGPLFKSVAKARIRTNSFGTRGSATFYRLQSPFNPDVARLVLRGTTIDFGCDLLQFG